MIWFDALLEKPADDDLIRHCIAVVLNIDAGRINVIHELAQIADVPVTCLVSPGSVDDYSQAISIYHCSDLQPPPILEGATRLALLLRRSLLVANDETADPYSFILVSGTGDTSVVLVDPAELDEKNRYVIAGHTQVTSRES